MLFVVYFIFLFSRKSIINIYFQKEKYNLNTCYIFQYVLVLLK
jgi:hypothetical protein